MPEIKATERDLIEEVSMATPKTSDTIILHPNNDGTYHWMCPNCKREDLGLSAETNLEDYLPNITCPNCGFQFGVDKRYLSTSYICGECLVVQRFDGACGNCGAGAMRRASTPVPLAPPRDTVEEVEALLAKATPGPWTADEMSPLSGGMHEWIEINTANDDEQIAEVTNDYGPQFRANAALIAAAPELLRCLVAEVKELRRCSSTQSESIMELQAENDSLRARMR